MKINRKIDYALRGLLDLATQVPAGGLASTAQIATRTGVPRKFLEAILVELRRAGLVQSQRGAIGGHRLARSATQISVGDVWRALEGQPPSRTRPAHRKAAVDGPSRALQGLWLQIEDAVDHATDSVSLSDLAQRAQEASKVVDFCI